MTRLCVRGHEVERLLWRCCGAQTSGVSGHVLRGRQKVATFAAAQAHADGILVWLCVRLAAMGGDPRYRGKTDINFRVENRQGRVEVAVGDGKGALDEKLILGREEALACPHIGEARNVAEFIVENDTAVQAMLHASPAAAAGCLRDDSPAEASNGRTASPRDIPSGHKGERVITKQGKPKGPARASVGAPHPGRATAPGKGEQALLLTDPYTGPMTPGFERLEAKLLSVGGERVVAMPEPRLGILLARGHVFQPKRVKRGWGVPHGCHIEVALRYAAHHALQLGAYEIATGWCLDDWFWFQHSWGWTGKHIIDPASDGAPWDCYFGVVLTPAEALRAVCNEVLKRLPVVKAVGGPSPPDELPGQAASAPPGRDAT